MGGFSYGGQYAFFCVKQQRDDLFWSRVAVSLKMKKLKGWRLIGIFSNCKGWPGFCGML